MRTLTSLICDFSFENDDDFLTDLELATSLPPLRTCPLFSTQQCPHRVQTQKKYIARKISENRYGYESKACYPRHPQMAGLWIIIPKHGKKKVLVHPHIMIIIVYHSVTSLRNVDDWGVSINGGTPSSHPFFFGSLQIPHCKPSSDQGVTPWLWKPLY